MLFTVFHVLHIRIICNIVPWFLVQDEFFAWFFKNLVSLLSFVRISNLYCRTYIFGLFANVVPFSHWSGPIKCQFFYTNFAVLSPGHAGGSEER